MNFQNYYTAIIIEPRKYFSLIDVITRFYDYLKDWKIIFFCGKNLKEYWEKLINLDIEIRELDVENLSLIEYSNLLKSLEFWESIKSKYVLVFQTDTWICSKNNLDIYNFIKYDYIGGYSPQNWWSNQLPAFESKPHIQCFNGGLSLRNRDALIKSIKSFPPKNTQNFTSSNLDFTTYHEDLYFVNCLKKLNYKIGIDDDAKKFCTHSKFLLETFGTHKFYYYINENEINRFLLYCPEAIKIIPNKNK